MGVFVARHFRNLSIRLFIAETPRRRGIQEKGFENWNRPRTLRDNDQCSRHSGTMTIRIGLSVPESIDKSWIAE
jgi:hypothetical protein